MVYNNIRERNQIFDQKIYLIIEIVNYNIYCVAVK